MEKPKETRRNQSGQASQEEMNSSEAEWELKAAEWERRQVALEYEQRLSMAQSEGRINYDTLGCTFGLSDRDYEALNHKAWDAVIRWADVWKRGYPPTHLILTGPVGTGKTYLALCVLMKMLSMGNRVMETNGYELSTRIFDHDRRHMNLCKYSQLLVIDDIEKGQWNQHTIPGLWDVCNARAIRPRVHRRTIITTNLSKLDLVEFFKHHTDNLPMVDSIFDRLNPNETHEMKTEISIRRM